MAHAQPQKALGVVLKNYFSKQTCDPVIGDNQSKPKIAFLNAQVPVSTNDVYSQAYAEFLKNSVCEQISRTHFLPLKNAGYNAHPTLPKMNDQPELCPDICIVMTGKFRTLNEEMIERSEIITRKGGTVMVVGEKMSGINSLRKRVQNRGIALESLSKFHSLVFWFTNHITLVSENKAPVSFEIEHNNKKFQTGSGLFSAEKIDQGSALLVEYFDNICGSVADLGAGWGYLSWELCSKSTRVIALDLYESEYKGIVACQENLRDFQLQTPIKYFWHDVCNEKIDTRYDQVIMNPPFHQDLNFRLDLGQEFIKIAAEILKPKGKLLMVANQHLAYEKLLSRYFSQCKILATDKGFKVISARK